MSRAETESRSAKGGRGSPRMEMWIWLFPATYVLHIIEEYRGGFHLWLSRVAGVDLSREDFLAINVIALVVMTAGTAFAWVGVAPGLPSAFATVITINGLLHLSGSLLTQSYSPGVVTGMLLWLPLGVYGLRRSRRELALAQFAGGVIIGVLLHVLVSAIALLS